MALCSIKKLFNGLVTQQKVQTARSHNLFARSGNIFDEKIGIFYSAILRIVLQLPGNVSFQNWLLLHYTQPQKISIHVNDAINKKRTLHLQSPQ